ncbi:sugar transferase [uncultured Gordonia sp.]|uniref:sugar transferase n=1 Tax=uncultured Gordonia sp. TaxID=198437 RepID=UPI00258C15CB|nr:sugar transferase [uncultured Gordonia sp.]
MSPSGQASALNVWSSDATQDSNPDIGARRSRPQWSKKYLARLAISDAVIVIAAVTVAHLLRFGTGNPFGQRGQVEIPATSVALILIILWLMALRANHALDRRVVGSGPQEYSRVATACFAVFGALAIVDQIFRLQIARGFLLLALPLGTIALLVSRYLWRRNLSRQRRNRLNMEKLLVVGSRDTATSLVRRLTHTPQLGYDVVGVCLPRTVAPLPPHIEVGEHAIPVHGDLDDVLAAVDSADASVVAVSSAEVLGPDAMQELSWGLERVDVDMLVAPGVADVAGPRLTVRPVAGLPLLHIDKPRYEGANRFRKALVDRVGAAVLILALAPAMCLVALAIVLDTGAPIFYRANRIGVNNAPFQMWKFRSMVVDADRVKADLRARSEGNGVLFKMRDDPRITRVGRIIRRYSLDELPQLFNVIGGTMSLVGPRPPLPDEVEQYDGRIARRMLVKPGMTGLWQVSGRSDLSWEDSIRLDLSYVENWSIMQDVLILWRTVRAVFDKTGAY